MSSEGGDWTEITRQIFMYAATRTSDLKSLDRNSQKKKKNVSDYKSI